MEKPAKWILLGLLVVAVALPAGVRGQDYQFATNGGAITASAENRSIVCRKSVGDNKTIVVQESIREEHRGPTKAEQDEIDKLDKQHASDPRFKWWSRTYWVKDRRFYHYTATIENSTNGVCTVWEKEIWDNIGDTVMQWWTERLTVRDVAVKNNEIAIVYSSIRGVNVDVLKFDQRKKYTLEYTQEVRGLGSDGGASEVRTEWLNDLLIHIMVTWHEGFEVWKVRKGRSELVTQSF